MLTILTVSCCAVITTPTLHQPIFTSSPRLIPIASQSGAASAFYTPGWMAVEYLHGVVNSALPDADELAALLYHLHQQPRFGWRIALSPLLAQYWSCCDPARRTPFWLRRLKQLQKNGEPRPLRLAPLHMDVHGDNIVLTSAGLRLIDWEYAATAILRWSWRQYGLRMNASTDNWQTLMPRARESTPGSYGDRYDYGTPGSLC